MIGGIFDDLVLGKTDARVYRALSDVRRFEITAERIRSRWREARSAAVG